MYYCNYVMTGRCKTFCGETAKEIHKKFMSEYGEAEYEVRKVEIFKENPQAKSLKEIFKRNPSRKSLKESFKRNP